MTSPLHGEDPRFESGQAHLVLRILFPDFFFSTFIRSVKRIFLFDDMIQEINIAILLNLANVSMFAGKLQV